MPPKSPFSAAAAGGAACGTLRVSTACMLAHSKLRSSAAIGSVALWTALQGSNLPCKLHTEGCSWQPADHANCVYGHAAKVTGDRHLRLLLLLLLRLPGISRPASGCWRLLSSQLRCRYWNRHGHRVQLPALGPIFWEAPAVAARRLGTLQYLRSEPILMLTSRLRLLLGCGCTAGGQGDCRLSSAQLALTTKV